MATQRLSTILVADRAVVLEDGRRRRARTPRRSCSRRRRRTSPRSSGTRPLPRSRRTGLSRLWPYTDGRRRRLAVVGVLAALAAACPVIGWHLVGDAIDNGIRGDDERRLAIVVVALRARERSRVAARHGRVARARRGRPARGARAAARPLRPPDVALAPLLLRAEGRLDHRPADERRRRALGRPQPGPDDARRQLADAARRARSGCSSSTGGSALVALCVLPPGIVVTRWFQTALARGVLRGAHADRRGHGPARRVGRRHGGRAGVQPRARVPARVRGAERGEPRRQRPRAEALVGLLPGDRAARRDRDGRRALRGRAADRRAARSRSAR